MLNPIFRRLITEDRESTVSGYANEDKIIHYFSNFLVRDKSAKNDRNASDMVIAIPGIQGTIGIEIKTTLDTEFGQLTVGYDTIRERWVIHESAFHKKKNKESQRYMEMFFDNYIFPFLKDLQPPSAEDSILKKRGDKEQVIVGFYKEPGHKEVLERCQEAWFGDGKEKRITMSPAALEHYYHRKGDDFLQINGLGIYKLSDRFDIDVPHFAELDFRADAKFHIKNHGDSFSFNVAFRADDLNRDRSKISKVDISTREGTKKFLEMF